VAKKHRDDRVGTRSLVTHVDEELYFAAKAEALRQRISMDMLGHIAWSMVLNENYLPALEALHAKLGQALAVSRSRNREVSDDANGGSLAVDCLVKSLPRRASQKKVLQRATG
jgi:hypothetical protein